LCPDCSVIQRGEHTTPHLRLKRTLAQGKLPKGTVLAIQDFTQVDLESGFVQDLIVCVYSHDLSMVQHLFLRVGKNCSSPLSLRVPPSFMFGVTEAPEKTISYNFFASYHGHSVCDGLVIQI